MLVYNLLEKEKKNLSFLGNPDGNIDVVLNMITEFKKHNINLEELKTIGENIEDKYLQIKLEDINKIFASYEEKKYIDEEDKLTILSKQLEETKAFENTLMYIDEFAGFTEQEYSVIRKLMKQANSVVIAMCAEPNQIDMLISPEADIFYYNKRAAKRLEEYARELGLQVENLVLLKEQYRFKNEELKHLEKNIYSHIYKRYEEDAQNISLALATNSYSELENIAQNITRLVQ
ncbi:MAG: hypothetical protein FWC68_04090, partial [Oscillospiraceae bacterium]|nr:hypothetical protein [Oscillospiraceae bacterium]